MMKGGFSMYQKNSLSKMREKENKLRSEETQPQILLPGEKVMRRDIFHVYFKKEPLKLKKVKNSIHTNSSH